MYSQVLNKAILPTFLRLTKSQFLELAAQIRARQFWPVEQMQAFQVEEVQRLAQHALDHVPFYRERFEQSGVVPAEIKTVADMQRIPITTKADLLQNFPDRMVAESLRNEEWQYVGTGGTTNRVMLVHDFDKRDAVRATLQICLTEDSDYQYGKKQVAIPPDACSALCGIEGFRGTSVMNHLSTIVLQGQFRDPEAISNLRGLVMNNWIQRAKLLDPFGPDGTHIGDEKLAEYISEIRAAQPTLLVGLPQYLHMLARYTKRSGDALRKIPVVRPMGANMSASVKEEIEEVLAGEVREHYGTQELGGVAFDCRQQQGMHIMSDQFVLELVREGRPVGAGELGSLVVTDLQNRAMPLIRYEIGDVARIDASPCACGRQTPRIRFEGRIEDTFVTNQGVVLTPELVCDHFGRQEGIDQFQLVERPSKWELKYVPSKNGVDESVTVDRFRQLTGDSRPVRVRQVNSILPESSGKFRHTKSISQQGF